MMGETDDSKKEGRCEKAVIAKGTERETKTSRVHSRFERKKKSQEIIRARG